MGFVFSLVSALFAASKDLISKHLAYKLDGTLSTFASFAYAVPFYVVLLAVVHFMGWEVWEWSWRFWMLVFMRAFTDVFAEGMKMHALGCGDISLVTIFFSLSPALIMVTSPLITGDPLEGFQIAAIILTVLGSLIVAYRPRTAGPRSGSQKKAILLALGAAFFFSLNSSFDRLAGRDFKLPVLSAFGMTLFSAFMVFPFVRWNRATLSDLKEHQPGLLARGLLETAFMTCKLIAIQHLTAPEVIAIQRLSVVFAVIGGKVLFKEGDFPRRFLASLFIVAGACVIVWGRWQSLQPESTS